MLTWGEFKDVLFRLLNDDVPNPDDHLYTEPMLLDAFRWATRQFAAHTAPMAEVTIDSTTLKTAPATFYAMDTDYIFTLPENVFENPELTGLVYWTTDGTNYVLPPIRTLAGTSVIGTVPGYWSRFQGGRWTLQVNLAEQLSSDSLTVVYYTYYTVPSDIDDVLEIPPWAEKAVALLCGANILNRNAILSTGTNQYNEVQSLRGGDINGWRLQQKAFNDAYALELSHYAQQNRKAVLK